MTFLKLFNSPKLRYRRDVGVLRWSVSIAVCVVLMSVWSLLLTERVRVAQVMSSSMEPTLMVGDRVVVSHIMPRRNIERGDIVTLNSPDDDGPPLVKRIAGVPGDTVAVKDGEFYVNGRLAPPPKPAMNYHYATDDFELTLPASRYFVLGDNRPFSHDSTEFGAVDEALIIGKVVYRLGASSPQTLLARETE